MKNLEVHQHSETCRNCGFKEISLSPREACFFTMMLQGNKTADIAKKMFVSPKTAATYRYRIMDKLGLSKSERSDIFILHAWIENRASVIQKNPQFCEGLSPEYIAGYLAALNDVKAPDFRMTNGEFGFLPTDPTERAEILPPLPIR